MKIYCPLCGCNVTQSGVLTDFKGTLLPVFQCSPCAESKDPFAFAVLPDGSRISTGDVPAYLARPQIIRKTLENQDMITPPRV